MARSLPEFVPPMLARLGAPFDSEEHLFEVKWDGVRALAFVEGQGYRLLSRKRVDLAPRYPELAPLAELPPGTVLDGELIVLRADGTADFSAVMSREHARRPLKIQGLARATPVTYVVFDLLYSSSEPRVAAPLTERRAELACLLEAHGRAPLVLSEGLVGPGRAFFEELRRRGVEGMLAKRLTSRYEPGRRSGAWTKVKTTSTVHCLILGYVPQGEHDLKSLHLAAADEGGGLAYVGRVGSGLGTAMRQRLVALLGTRRRAEPLVACSDEGIWVEPGLYCAVSYLERTREGHLRAPVFTELIADGT